jgi:hypothetical protein
MATSVRFYRDQLGFVVASTDGRPAEECDWVLLRLGDVELMLNTAYEADERPAAPDPARIASHEDTCVFFDCPDVDAAYDHLRAHEVLVDPPSVTHYGFRSMSLKDPDGYGLCFHWPANQ